MSRNYNSSQHPHHNRPPIVVHEHDVLSGRGVNIAHHSGNERFRTLVNTRADESYCTSYSASEKRAVAEEIIKHIKSLDPPGRFLKRDGRGQVSRGLNGPWQVLTDREAIKKTCQALRDCNRQDRAGYAVGVQVPDDVRQEAANRSHTGLTGKQQAAQAAAVAAAKAAAAASASLKRTHHQFLSTTSEQLQQLPPVQQEGGAAAPACVSVASSLQPLPVGTSPPTGGRVSPSVENAAEWLKKQRTDEQASSAAAAAPLPFPPPPAASYPSPPDSLVPPENGGQVVPAAVVPTPVSWNHQPPHHVPQAVAAPSTSTDMQAALGGGVVAYPPPMDFPPVVPTPAVQHNHVTTDQDVHAPQHPAAPAAPTTLHHPGAYSLDNLHPEEVAPAPYNISEL